MKNFITKILLMFSVWRFKAMLEKDAEEGDRQMDQLTPNTNVSEMEQLGFEIGDMLYATKLRKLLVKAVDSPEHEYDDRLLAAADGAFNFKG